MDFSFLYLETEKLLNIYDIVCNRTLLLILTVIREKEHEQKKNTPLFIFFKF